MKIKIPFKTPSVNHLYGQHGVIKYLKPEAKRLRKEILEITQTDKKPFSEKEFLEIHVKIYEDWFTKKGEIKRKDISNREKFLLDSIFEGIRLDDKQIFKHTMQKVQSQQEFAEIEIKKLSGGIFDGL